MKSTRTIHRGVPGAICLLIAGIAGLLWYTYRKGEQKRHAPHVNTARAPVEAPARNAQGQSVLHLPLLWRNGPVPPQRLRFVVETSDTAPTLTLFEGDRPATLPVVFTSLLGNPGIWPHSELNQLLYQLQRGYYTRDGYQFCGLVESHNRTYLGIRWYSPPSSHQEIFAACAFRLEVQGSTLELTLLRRTGGGEWPNGGFWSAYGKFPCLSSSAQGELLMTESDGVFALGAADKWRKVGPPPKRP